MLWAKYSILTLASTLLLTPMLRLINVTSENPEVYNAAYEYCFVIFNYFAFYSIIIFIFRKSKVWYIFSY